ncbi:helix-turn-helix domain-containing protein [Cohnella sp. GCM10020058]|uniref:helix-turn-helix domain-containing protein n=1 Tax=Cohnella sp. GCM10020058 TaxID=3317330 RepID=UPI003642D94C
MSQGIGQIIGDRIRNYRKRRGISQEKLAGLAEFSVSFIGEVERAEKSPSLENLNKICKALGITVQELFEQAQPASVSKEAKIISGIVNKIQPLSIKDLSTVSEMVDLMIKFKK